MITKKRLIILAIIVVVLVVGIVVVSTGQKKGRAPGTSTTNTANSDATFSISGLTGLGLEDLFTANDDSISTQQSYQDRINSAVYGAIQSNVATPNNAYSASVRTGSYASKTVDDVTDASFLVDIPELKRTFKVAVEYAAIDDSSTVHILCPTNSELAYPAITCNAGQ